MDNNKQSPKTQLSETTALPDESRPEKEQLEPPGSRFSAVRAFASKYRKPLQIAFMLLVLVVVFFVIKNELKSINVNDLHRLSHDMSLSDKLRFVVLGLIAFSFCSLYDFVFAHRFELDIPNRTLFRIGWIAQSFNNFVGFGGVTGGTLRVKLYKDVDTDEEKALKLSAGILISTLLGLFVLALPAAFGLFSLGQAKYLPICVVLFSLALVYLFGDKLPLSVLRHPNSPLHYLSRKTRIETLAASSLEWFVAALFFAYALRYFDSSIPWTVGILVYTVATAIGIASMVPGGLGTFDGTVIAMMTALGYDNAAIVMALLVERLIYTFLPWLIAVVWLSVYAFRNRFDAENHMRLSNLLSQVISIGVFLCGLVLFFSVVTPGVFWRLHLLHHHVPAMLPLLSRTITGFFAVLLIILSRGIRLRVRRANYVTTAVLIAASLTCLMKGLDYEEAVMMLIFAAMLFLTRSLFVNPAVPLNRRTFAQITAALVVVAVVFYAGYNILLDTILYHVGDDHLLMQHYALPFVIAALVLMGILISFATLTTRRRYLQFTPPSDEEHERFMAIVEEYGGNMFAHLSLMKDKMYFFNEKNTVAMMYRPVKHHILVLGDPIGNPEDISDALDELIRWANDAGMLVSFYEISGAHLVDYIDEGFRFLKLGEDARVDLSTFTLSGKKNRGLRHTRGVMEKGGYQFRVSMPPHSDASLAEWKAISDDWIGERDELQFSLGGFYAPYLQAAPVFELVDADGKVQAFANMMYHVGDGVLSVDLMRYRKDAPDAVMDMMFISLFEWAKEQGYQTFDLGVSPLANVGRALYSDNREKLIRTAYEFGNRIYSFGGLHNFKSKFRPNWHPVYLAYKDNRNLTDVLLSLILLIHQKPAYDSLRVNDMDDDMIIAALAQIQHERSAV